MKKIIRKLFAPIALLSLALGVTISINNQKDVVGAKAATYSHTITAKTWAAYGTQTLSGISWTAAATGGAYWGYDAAKGQQFGSAKQSASALSLSTNGFSGTISSLKISTSGASSVVATLSVSVGGVTYSPASTSITATNTQYTFTGTSSGQVVINWANSSAKALYLKSIIVEYSSAAKTLSSIAVTTPPTQTAYYAGDTFNRAGMVVTASFSDSSSSTVSYDASGANGYNYSTSALIAGATIHTISYTFEGVTKTANVTISVTAVVLSSISISGTPTKTTYLVGQSFDPTGITVTATRNNGSTANVTSSTTFTPDPLTVGTTSVTASYTEGAVTKTATVSGLIVKDVSLVSISVSGTPNKTSYYAGENFVPTGVTITAHYDDSSSRVLGFEEVTFAPTPLTAGTTSVTVTFDNGVTEKSTTISGLTVTAVVLNSITIKTPASKTNFKLGETFSHSGLVINANYNSGTIEKTSGFTVTGVDTMVLGHQTATVEFGGKTTSYVINVTNIGANAGHYENTPGSYNSLYSGSGMWTTTGSDFNMGNSYNTYNQAILSSTDSVSGSNWTISTGNFGTWGSGVTGTTGINLGVNSQTIQPLPNYISNMDGFSSLPNHDKANLYIGMNFNVTNPAKFSMKLITEKVMDAYIVYSTNNGSSYSILGNVHKTTVSDGSTWNEIEYAGQSSLGNSVRFGVLLLCSATSKIRTRVGDIGVYNYTPGSQSWVNGDFTPLEQATAFADFVNDGLGNNAEGNCEIVLEELLVEYNAMSEFAKEEFETNTAQKFIAARARIAYLESWVDSNGTPLTRQVATNDTKNEAAVVLIGVIGLTTLVGYYFINKKKFSA